jgi:plastocyanin
LDLEKAMQSTHRNPGLLRWAHFLLISTVLLGSGACSSNSNIEHNSSVPPVLASLMPPIPPDPAQDHSASAVQQSTITADLFYEKSLSATGDGTKLQMPSTPLGITWAIYEFGVNSNTLQTVRSDYTPQTGDSVWLGLADYTRHEWDFHGPYVSDSAVTLSPDNVSPGGNFFFAVITYNGTSITLNSSVVTVDVAPTADVNMTATHQFDPQVLNVDAGTVITWHNIDVLPHTVTVDALNAFPGGPDSDIAFPSGVAAGGSYSFAVPASAASGTTWYYHCRFHGLAGDGTSLGTFMAGKIQVN